MKRLTVGLAVLAVTAAWATLPARADDQDKPPSVKEIMTKAHKGGNSILGTLRKDLQSPNPDWPDVQKKTKELISLGTSLGKNEPPQGEKSSWERMTRLYLDQVKALDKAAQKQDKQATGASLRRLTGLCMACHQVHRPRE
jgi:hypothetical protein